MTTITSTGQKPAKLADAIQDYFREQDFGPGSILPSERELADALGVGRAQVRTAYRQMEQERTVRSISPRKRVLAQPSGSQANELMSRSIVVMSAIAAPRMGTWLTGNQEHLYVTGVAHASQAQELNVLMQSPANLGEDRLRQLIDAGPLGLVGFGPMLSSPSGILFLERLRQAGIPVVGLGGDLEETAMSMVSFDVVMSDHESGAYQLVHWLAKRGRRRILFLGEDDDQCRRAWSVGRRRGYRRACAELGLPTLERGTPERAPSEGAPQASFRDRVAFDAAYLRDLLTGSDAADAIMLLSDGACGVIGAACRELGREPGRDILLAGYDNYWMSPDLDWGGGEPIPPAVTMDKRADRIGEALVDLICRRASGTLKFEPQQTLVAPELIDIHNA